MRACILHLLILGLICACEYPTPAEPPIRFAITTPAVSFDPRFATDAVSTRINQLIYRQLVKFDNAFNPVADLARWEIRNPLHYRFTLQSDGRRFHDGSRLLSRDVKSTYDFILQEENASPYRSTFSMIQRIEVIDEDTLDFYLFNADPLFPGYLTIGILPASVNARSSALTVVPIGSGDFAFERRSLDEHVILRRLHDSQRIEFIPVRDATTRVLKLVRGEIDMLQNDLDAELVGFLKRSKHISIQQVQGTNFTYLGFNLLDNVVGDNTVRRAIAHAIDRSAIIQHLFAGAARPSSALLPPEHWAGYDTLEYYRYNPSLALALMQSAGYSMQSPLRVVYKTSSDPFRIRLATVIQSQLAKVGINVEVQSFDWGTFYGDIKAGRFQMFSLSWVGVQVPDIFRNVFHSNSVPPNGANRGRFVDQRADELIEQAMKEGNFAKQAAAYRALQHYLLEQLPYVPLWFEDHVLAVRDNIVGYTLQADGNYSGLRTIMRKH